MSTNSLSATFAALADPTRRAILARLSESGPSPVKELARPFRMSQPAVTKHLKVLENAGLIVRTRDAQFRPCAIKAEPMKEALDYIEQYRKHWVARFDRLDDYLNSLQLEDNENEP
jgi:DNA-binding transcriptional ArsR family regulator